MVGSVRWVEETGAERRLADTGRATRQSPGLAHELVSDTLLALAQAARRKR